MDSTLFINQTERPAVINRDMPSDINLGVVATGVGKESKDGSDGKEGQDGRIASAQPVSASGSGEFVK